MDPAKVYGEREDVPKKQGLAERVKEHGPLLSESDASRKSAEMYPGTGDDASLIQKILNLLRGRPPKTPTSEKWEEVRRRADSKLRGFKLPQPGSRPREE